MDDYERIINKYTQEVLDNNKKTKSFKLLSKEIQQALDKYKKSNDIELVINVKLKNQYLGRLL